jgi:hypothetical protein
LFAVLRLNKDQLNPPCLHPLPLILSGPINEAGLPNALHGLDSFNNRFVFKITPKTALRFGPTLKIFFAARCLTNGPAAASYSFDEHYWITSLSCVEWAFEVALVIGA